MNKHIIKGGLAGVAVLALAAGGSTFASWSDYDVSTGNQAGAGILKLNVSDRNGAGGTIQPLNLAPGQNKYQEFFLASADADNVPVGKLFATIQNVVDTEDGAACTTKSEAVAEGSGVDGSGEPTDMSACGSQGELSSQMGAQILYSDPVPGAASCPNTGIYSHNYGSKTLQAQAAEGQKESGTLAKGEGICVRIEMSLPSAADNKVQGDDVSYDYRFDLVQ